TTPTPTPVIPRDTTPTPTPVIPRDTTPTPTPTPVIPRDITPTPTPVIPRDTTPTLTPVIPRDTTPTLTPVIPRDTTPTLTPVIPRDITPTPTPVIPRDTTQDETMPTRNYIGVGGNFGLSGDTALGENAFTIYSKIGLTNNFSFRPAAAISDKAVFLIPVTIDFPVESITDLGESQIIAVPYIGGGAAISTSEGSSVGFLLTGGVDVPVSPKFTATAGVNVDFIDKTDVGLLLGIGYNF
ncbi:hypothetical protein, partial [uncultured Nostoc sp.]